jgi:hypothetical protein
MKLRRRKRSLFDFLLHAQRGGVSAALLAAVGGLEGQTSVALATDLLVRSVLLRQSHQRGLDNTCTNKQPSQNDSFTPHNNKRGKKKTKKKKKQKKKKKKKIQKKTEKNLPPRNLSTRCNVDSFWML